MSLHMGPISIKNYWKTGAFIFSLCLLQSFSVHAQTNAERTIQQNQQIIQDREQRERFEQRQEQFQRDQNALGAELGYQKQALPKVGPCVQVNEININGVTLLAKRKIMKVAQSSQGHCLYMADINNIIESINALYVEKGFISSRAYLPEQDLSRGVLTVQVIEGTLENIKIEDSDAEFDIIRTPSQMSTAFPDMIGKPLNIRDIEQGLDQINRLPSNQAKTNLLPGKNPGGSILSIKNQQSKVWRFSTGIDNSGSQSTGVLQGTISGAYDNLLGINDALNLSIKHDLDRTTRRQSKNMSFKYEVPYGYWTFSYGLNYFDYVSELKATAQNFKTSGRSRNHTLTASKVMHRDQVSKTTLTSSLVAKENENYFETAKLDVSSRKLTIANLGLSHSRKIPSGFMSGSITYSRGLKWLGAFKDTASSFNAQFNKVSFDANIIKQFDFGLGHYNPRIDLSGSAVLSSDDLFSTETLSIGGPYSVRGFKNNSISGDRGGYFRSDISCNLPPFGNKFLRERLGVLRPFIGFDIGSIRTDHKNERETGTLKSLSLGLKNTGGKIGFGVTYSKPISAPKFINKESEELFFRMTIKF